MLWRQWGWWWTLRKTQPHLLPSLWVTPRLTLVNITSVGWTLAQQRMNFLQQLRKFNLPYGSLLHLHHWVWCAAAIVLDRGRLQCIIPSVEKVIGCSLSSLLDMHISRTLRQAGGTVADPSHPGHKVFQPRCSCRRQQSTRTKTSHHKNISFLSAVSSTRPHWSPKEAWHLHIGLVICTVMHNSRFNKKLFCSHVYPFWSCIEISFSKLLFLSSSYYLIYAICFLHQQTKTNSFWCPVINLIMHWRQKRSIFLDPQGVQIILATSVSARKITTNLISDRNHKL